ncbi:hypothetical protein ACWGS9_34410 [Bradyrhizobium sp. Arg314]
MTAEKTAGRLTHASRIAPDERAPALADWVRQAMRFIDLCDADSAGYDELHEDARQLTVAGYALFGADVISDGNWCLADLEGRQLAGLSTLKSE